MNKRIISAVASLIILLPMLTSCALPAKPGIKDMRYKYADLSDYPGMKNINNRHIYEMEINEMCEEMDEGNTFAVLFSHSECPYCKASMPIIYDYLQKNDYQLGYINCRKNPSWRSNILMDDYDLLVEHVGEYFRLDDFDRAHLYVPHVFFIKNGEVISQYSGVAPTYKSTESCLTESEAHFMLSHYETGYYMMTDNSAYAIK